MKLRRAALPLALISMTVMALMATAALAQLRPPVGNRAVPQPAKPVDIGRYAGLWYEMGRYENSFERGCEAVSAEYRMRDDGLIQVVNACRQRGLDGPIKMAKGRAVILPGSGNAKLKVSFFGPFFIGDYWVLDHGDDYDWSIVGEPSGRFLWLLTRSAEPSPTMRAMLESRARELGYDTTLIRPTLH
ncbi:MAG TPA: lipocalin family protein [Caulobacteraceae bacterium]|jgi:apolipoprotein D and lipocalin family protein